MKNTKAGSLLLVISSEGIPVMVVPATNIQDAHNQARMLLRDEKSRAVGPMMARSGVRVTLFQAALFGGDADPEQGTPEPQDLHISQQEGAPGS